MIMRECGGSSVLGAGFASGEMTHPGKAPRQPVNDPLESYPSHKSGGGRCTRRTEGTLKDWSQLCQSTPCAIMPTQHATALPAQGDNKAFMPVPHQRGPQWSSEGGLGSRKKGGSFQLCMGLGIGQKRVLRSPCQTSK